VAVDVEALYTRYGGMVFRRCRALLRDDEKAADAMHDVFVQVLRREHALTEAAPSSMLFRIATNVSLNRIRGEHRRPEAPDDDLLRRIAAAGDEHRSTARAMLERIFGAEPESTRTMAVMHLLDGMTLEEVAAEVGLSVSGVRKRLRTLRARVSELEGV
jgi:RNA polymerase sigma-70 factor (ECF subfamily)